MSSAFTGSPTNYRVVATFTQTVDWNSGSGYPADSVPLIVITTKTATTFHIEIHSYSGATVNAPTGGVTIDWIAIPTN
jgi:hypothetical protein